uniref:TNase-like domain-containing protein n=1 Tax=Oryza punctata TaxID=4537 RepID=A0A0E0MIS4_ORYPU
MGNILRCFKGDDDGGGDHYPYYKPTSRPPDYHGEPAAPARAQQQQPLGPHGVTPSTVGVAALAHDLHIHEYNTTTKTPVDAAQLIARALNMIQRADLEFYNFPISALPTASSNDQPSSLPDGVQFVLNTLPVYDKCIGDGDGFTAYVSTTDPRESANVPLEVHELVIARTQARKCRDYQSADALLSSLDEAGYKILSCSDDEVLARKYRIRMRGIDAPELKMPYGKESRNALVKLIGGKRVNIYVYDLDQFGRYVGANAEEWPCMHFKTYDKRPEFARWEREARAANRGLWASGNPEKPWDWRRDQHNARQDAIQVY